MKKILLFTTVLSLVLLSGCTKTVENSATAFALDTVVNIKANAEKSTIDAAIDLVKDYEDVFSRTKSEGELAALNSKGEGEVSEELLSLINLSLEYCEKTNGAFDITIAPVSSLWDFNSDVLPETYAITEALSKVDYKKIEVNNNLVKLNGSQIDLGASAKGWIAQKTIEKLKESGVANATVNLGGNIALLGGKLQNVGVKDPMGNGIKATLRIKNTLVSTAGVYERYIEKNGKRYHHILDTKTGYGIDTDVLSASVVCEDGAKGDILATCCLILGSQKALELINATEGAEALIITADGEIHISSGIYCEDGYYIL